MQKEDGPALIPSIINGALNAISMLCLALSLDTISLRVHLSLTNRIPK